MIKEIVKYWSEYSEYIDKENKESIKKDAEYNDPERLKIINVNAVQTILTIRSFEGFMDYLSIF